MPKFSKVKRCYHCGEILQCEQKDLPGYVKKETLEKYPDGLLLCDNCYESESAKIPQECKLDDEFVTILEQIKSNKDLVVYVVDLFSFEGSFISKVTDMLNGCDVLVRHV